MSDHLFPRYHVRPPSGYLNDPNGPVVAAGVVHLYFQYRHGLDHASPVHWGHVSSPDLVHWQYHPLAISPHPGLEDRDGCWSGNTVVDDAGTLRAFYSGFVHGQGLQGTVTAPSPDGGASFGPPRRVVPDPPAEEEIAELRDPFVWREGSGWRMVLGTGDASQTAALRLYASADLDSWEYCGPMALMPRTGTSLWDSGAMWECPQVLATDGVTVAVVGSWSPERGIMDVLSFVVPDPGEPASSGAGAGPAGDAPVVQAGAVHLVDQGPNFYAASVLRDGPEGPLMWGWATEGRAPEWCASDGWSGMLTLPRSVSLRPDGALASRPLPGMSALRTDQAGIPVDGVLEGLGAQLEFVLGTGGSACTVRLAFGDGEYLEIAVDGAGAVTVDRDHASNDLRADRGVVVIPAGPQGHGDLGHEPEASGLPDPAAGIRGFVDGSVLELFLPDGRVATTRFYPTSPPPWRVELAGGAGTSLLVWELTSLDAAGGNRAAVGSSWVDGD